MVCVYTGIYTYISTYDNEYSFPNIIAGVVGDRVLDQDAGCTLLGASEMMTCGAKALAAVFLIDFFCCKTL